MYAVPCVTRLQNGNAAFPSLPAVLRHNQYMRLLLTPTTIALVLLCCAMLIAMAYVAVDERS